MCDMRSGRPPLGSGHVVGLDGDRNQKKRLRVILETLSGELSVGEACARLAIGESRFHELRHRVLQCALDGLAPRPPGRRPKEVRVDPEELAFVRRENGWLREELELSRMRTEIALVMPEVLREPKSEPPVRGGKNPARRTRRRSGARRNGTGRG